MNEKTVASHRKHQKAELSLLDKRNPSQIPSMTFAQLQFNCIMCNAKMWCAVPSFAVTIPACSRWRYFSKCKSKNYTEILHNFLAPNLGCRLTYKICGFNKIGQRFTLQETQEMFSGKYKLEEWKRLGFCRTIRFVRLWLLIPGTRH